jgi:SpoIID/LytB domain protein
VAALAILVSGSLLGLASVASLATPAAAADPSFTFTGGGFGHGVGLSQYGARGAARAGLNSTQILQHYYTGSSVGTAAEPNDLRIRLGTWSSATVGSTTNTGTGEVTLLVDGNWAGVAPRGTQIAFTPNGSGITAKIGNGATFNGSWAAVEFNYSGSIIQTGPSGTRFDRGVLVATSTGSSVQLNINRLTMTEYLYGLAEIPSSWEVPALEAQVIAARSYAINRRRGPSSSFDLEATTVDQVYAGYDKAAGGSFDRWKGAVDSTAGKVVKAPDGSVANALYSSGHGGISEDNDYVFGGASAPGTPISYLRSVNDPYEANSDNPYYRWTRTYTGAELGTWFGIGTVTAVRFEGPFGKSGRIDRAQVTLVTASGNKTVRGDAFRRTINSNTPFDRELLSTLLLNNPVGNLEAVSATPGGVRAQGWAWNPSTSDNTAVDLYVDGTIVARGYTGVARADVAKGYPGAGPNQGFDFTAPASGGSHRVCAYVIGNLASPAIGCRDVTVASTPIGNFEAVRGGSGEIGVSGWAIDRSRTSADLVDVYVDGRWAATGTADKPRPDVGAAYPGYGPNHGFDFTVPAGPGSHQVCTFAIDDGGNHLGMGCRTATSTGNGDAAGNLEAVRRPNPNDPFTIQVSGWALDRDTTAPTDVHLYLDAPYPDGTGMGAIKAGDSRPDVGAAFPGLGNGHGFTANLKYPPGRHKVCAYAINTAGGGKNVLIGCLTPPNAVPIGNLEAVQRTSATQARISGWTIDPDTTGSLKVHVYVGGPVGGGGTFAGAFDANLDRPDVAGAYPGFGAAHGFDATVTIPSGSTPVYVYVIDDAAERNPQLGTKTV